jgi:hypothetical protein
MSNVQIYTFKWIFNSVWCYKLCIALFFHLKKYTCSLNFLTYSRVFSMSRKQISIYRNNMNNTLNESFLFFNLPCFTNKYLVILVHKKANAVFQSWVNAGDWKPQLTLWMDLKFGNVSAQLRIAAYYFFKTFLSQVNLIEFPELMYILKPVHHHSFHLKKTYWQEVNLLYWVWFDRAWTFCSWVS